jgi:hypothetical protein
MVQTCKPYLQVSFSFLSVFVANKINITKQIKEINNLNYLKIELGDTTLSLYMPAIPSHRAQSSAMCFITASYWVV